MKPSRRRSAAASAALAGVVVAAACGGTRPEASGPPPECAAVAPAPKASASVPGEPASCDVPRSAELDWRKAACAAKEAESCRTLAWMYGYGHGVRADPTLAKDYAEKACDGYDGRGCWLRAVFEGGPAPERATWLERGCEQGDGGSCLTMGALEAAGKAPKKSYLEESCSELSPEGCRLVSDILLARAESSAVRTAARALERPERDTATLGVCSARYALEARPDVRVSGCDFAMVSCPEGCDAQCDAEIVDRRTWLVTTLQMGCDAGDVRYCHGLGILRAFGDWRSRLGVILEKDLAAGAALLEKACADGFAPSCTEAAKVHEWLESAATDDAGKAREREAAQKLERRACDAKQPTACYALAAHADTRADELAFYRKACELGMSGVCLDLALRYATGRDAPKDPKAALDVALLAR